MDDEWESLLWQIVLEGIRAKLKSGEPLSERQQEVYNYYKDRGQEWIIIKT